MTKDRKPFASARRASFARPKIPLALLLVSAALAAGTADAQTRDRDAFFERLDTNGDGIADADELLAARRDAFARADKDDNGYVTGAEVDALVGNRGDAPRTRRGGLVRGIGQRRMPGVEAAVRRLDSDKDGRISEAEFVEAKSPLLERFDANRDGAISREEVDRAQQRMRAQAQRRRAL